MVDAPATRREVQLHGGTSNRGLVVKVAGTVRRPRSPGNAAVHALLRHLEDVGFDGAPRVLGIDDDGREVLSFVEGDVPIDPYPGWALTDDALASVGRLLRRFHRATRSFDPSDHRWGSTVPSRWRGDVVVHNDPNLDNVVFRDGEAVALIDFDLASPGAPLWDLAITTRLWVPLRDPVDVPDDRRHRVRERVAVIADAYGLPPEDRPRLVAAAQATHDWCYDVMRAGAERGQAGYADAWTPAKRGHVERGRTWFREHTDLLIDDLESAEGR
jgi:Ser/Thr protein kinase RdoA (MazF antagonist)